MDIELDIPDSERNYEGQIKKTGCGNHPTDSDIYCEENKQ